MEFAAGDKFTLVRRHTEDVVSTFDVDALQQQRAAVQARRDAEIQRCDGEIAEIDALLAQCDALKIVSRAASVAADAVVTSPVASSAVVSTP